MPINEIPIGYVAIETDTRKPYTGGASSGAKIFRTLGLAQGAIKRQLVKRNYEFYEVYYKNPNA